MSTIQRNPAPDELDALLSAFFRAELPSPFPAFKAPAAPPAPANWLAQSRSRLALAASVVALLAASWWMAGRNAEYATPVTVPGTGVGNAQKGVPAHLDKGHTDKPAPANNR